LPELQQIESLRRKRRKWKLAREEERVFSLVRSLF
jgi:hypothetical protein